MNYFNKPLDELTIAEAAYLAALPKAPNNYHPARQHDAAVARRNWVIGRMQEDGYITAEETEQAKAEPLEVRRREETDYVTADYFAEEVRRQLSSRFGEQQLYEGGYSVRTTVDPKLQEVATRSLRDGLITYDRRHGWRGPVARLESFDNWSKQLAETTVPAGGEIWQLATVLEVSADRAEIGIVRWRARAHSPGRGQMGTEMAGRRAAGAGGEANRRCACQRRCHPGRTGDQGREGQGTSGRDLRPAPDPGGSGRAGRDGPPYRPRAGDERRFQLQDQRFQPRDAGAAAAGLLVQAVRLYGGAGQRLHAFDPGDGCALCDPARSGTAAVAAAELLARIIWDRRRCESAWKSLATS